MAEKRYSYVEDNVNYIKIGLNLGPTLVLGQYNGFMLKSLLSSIKPISAYYLIFYRILLCRPMINKLVIRSLIYGE